VKIQHQGPQGIGIVTVDTVFADRQPCLKGLDRLGSEENKPLSIPFPSDSNPLLRQRQVRKIHSSQLRDTTPGAIEELQDKLVPDAGKSVIRHVQDFPDLFLR
jgi:hypothetical protein